MTIVNKVFIDHLPRWNSGINSGRGVEGTVNWKKSVGEKVNFIYKDIEGTVNIVGYNPKNRSVIVKYKDNPPFEMTAASLRKCNLGGLLKNDIKFKYNEDDLRRVDLRNLPRNSSGIDWGNSIGKCFNFVYDDFDGYIEILDYQKKGQMLKLKFGDKITQTKSSDILKCKIKTIIGERDTNHTYKVGDIIHTNFCIIEIIECFRKYEKSHGGNMKWYKFKCISCGWMGGEIRENDLKGKNKGSCPKCGDGNSYPNKIGFNVLEQLGLLFECEYSPDWIKPRRYDFYFEFKDKKYIVEMDGGFHNNDNLMTGLSANDLNNIDNYKEKIAKQQGIEIIRIDCKVSDLEYIKNSIYNSLLNKLFNLDIIDWVKSQEFASTSRVYIAAEIYNKYKNLTPKEVGLIMNTSNTSARKYLKIAQSLGLCNYVPNKGSSRKIKVIDGINETIYDSAFDFSQKCNNIYGFDIGRSYITTLIKENRKYNGLSFEFVVK